jgi:hypothetical protein
MPQRTAKVSIGMDIRQLREDTKRAEQLLKNIGKVKIDTDLQNNLKKIVTVDLTRQISSYTSQIVKIRDTLKDAGRAGNEAFNTQKLSQYVRELGRLSEGLRRVQDLQGKIASGGGGGLGGGGESRQRGYFDPGGYRGPRIQALSGISRGLGMIGVSYGIQQSLVRAEELAETRMRTMALTGGQIEGNGMSRFGFTRQERAERALEISRQAGRRFKPGELGGLVERGESAERGFGIGGGEFARGIGAARRAGIQDQAKFVSGAIGDAVAMKLEGSQIGDYLSQMTGYLESVSEGIDVNQDSLRGFASALGSLDFFKADPRRIFGVFDTLNQLFRGQGTPYQNFATYRAMQETATQGGGKALTPAGIELRRMMGMFGEGGEGRAKRWERLGMPEMGDVERLGGGEFQQRFLSRSYKESRAQSPKDAQAAAYLFQTTTGLKGKAGADIFMKFREQELAGKELRLGSEDIKKAADDWMTAEERARKNMDTFSGSVMDFKARTDDLKQVLADFTTKGVVTFQHGADKFAEYAAKLLGEKTPDVTTGETSLRNQIGSGRFLDTLKGQTRAFAKSGIALRGDLQQSQIKQEVDWENARKTELTQQGVEGDKLEAQINQERAKRREDIGQKLLEQEKANLKKSKAGGWGSKLGQTGWTTDIIEQPSDVQLLPKAQEKRMGGVIINMQDGGNVPASDLQKSVNEALKLPAAKKRALQKAKKTDSSTFAETVTKNLIAIKKRTKAGYAGGGAIGTDTVDIKATPGEFMVNARDASANMMALVHANAGGKIAPAYSQGGAIIPSSVRLDTGGHEHALGGNTSAVHNLTRAIYTMAFGGVVPSMRSFPRGVKVRLGV